MHWDHCQLASPCFWTYHTTHWHRACTNILNEGPLPWTTLSKHVGGFLHLTFTKQANNYILQVPLLLWNLTQ